MAATKKENVSLSVIRRLPRYYRYLGDLLTEGKSKISSKELSEMMNLTASQIRQDLNCFGGFGQQGYGYNIPALRGEIATILRLNTAKSMVLIGAGNLGRAISAPTNFNSSGFKLVGIFDVDPTIVGTTLCGHVVQNGNNLEDFCRDNKPKAAILCIPQKAAEEILPLLIQCGVRSFLNFSHYDIGIHFENVVVENVHITDSLMTLAYRMDEQDS